MIKFRSLLSVLIVFSVTVWLSRGYQSHLITWDSVGYYYYLPAHFIHDDLQGNDVQWLRDAREKYDFSATLYQVHVVKDRPNFIPQYSIGMAYLYAPAFFVGHAMAKHTGQPQDGFSKPYQRAMYFWSLIIALAGLLVLRWFLNCLFSDPISAWTILLMGAGSNYFLQVSGGLATAHNYIFLLYALILLASYKWLVGGSRKWFFLLAGFFGIAFIARPSEIVAIFIPLMFAWSDREKWKENWKFITARRNLIPAFLIAFAFVIPQLLYWKYTTGHFFYMSYSNPGEGFDFLFPHTIDFLFSYRKGWFIYTPMMLIAMFGFVYLWRNYRQWFWSFLSFMVLTIYLLSSWSVWWYAQCFSQRSMVQSLPVMAFLLAVLISGIKENKSRWWVYGAMTLAVSLTIFFSWQYNNGILSKDRMTASYFWRTFGKTSVTEEDKQLLLVKRSFDGVMDLKDTISYSCTQRYSFPNQDVQFKDVIIVDSISSEVLKLDEEKVFSKPISKPFRDWTDEDHFWMRVSAEVFIPDSTYENELMVVTTAEHGGKTYSYFTKSLDELPRQTGKWKRITTDYMSPEVRVGKDPIKTYMWWRGKGEAYVRDFQVEIWEKK